MKSKTIGAVIMVVLIAISLPLGTGRSLSRLQEESEMDYYYDSTGFALYEGIEEREAAASNLITVANRYTSDNPHLIAYVDDLEYQIKASRNLFDDMHVEEAEQNIVLGESAKALAEQLEKIELSERDAKYPALMIAQMESEQDKLERSSYNDEAIAFNEKLEAFPVKYLYHFTGIEPLGVFRQEES